MQQHRRNGNASSSAGDKGSNKKTSSQQNNSAETIKVMARVRPIIDREIRNGCEEAIQVSGNMIAVSGKRAFSSHGNRSCHRFDKVFGMKSSQSEVFGKTQPLIDAALEGYNSTIFAYGQTGTGKTHTMLGVDIWRLGQEQDSAARAVNAVIDDKKLWGIIPRAMQYVFQKLKISERTTLSRVKCSYLEIYNEHVYDLLRYEQSKMLKSGLEIREDKRRGVFVPDATEISVSTDEEVLSILWKGAKNRAMVATDMNTHSSRSHTIFRVVIERKSLAGATGADGDTKIIRSKINLVDLAGSEKWKPHQLSTFSDTRVKEMTSINQSLSNLGNCVRALLERGRQHIPYRNSKLTRLLQDSLGGNTKTAFIVTLSPSSDAIEESQSTLQFADRAKKVVVHAMVNETLDDASMLRKYEHQIARLKAMLKKSTLQQHAPSSQHASVADTKELEELRGENIRLMKQLQKTKTELHHTMEENRAMRRALRSKDDGGDVAAEREALEARNRTLEKKLKSVQDAENQQREQKEWLRKYHTWLRSLPVQETKVEGEDASRSTLDLKGRLNLLEWSVLMQSEELQRTKRAFLQELQPLQEELHQKCLLLESAEEREANLRRHLPLSGGHVRSGGTPGNRRGETGAATTSTVRREDPKVIHPTPATDEYATSRVVGRAGTTYNGGSSSRSTSNLDRRVRSTTTPPGEGKSPVDAKSDHVFEKLANLREQMHREQLVHAKPTEKKISPFSHRRPNGRNASNAAGLVVDDGAQRHGHSWSEGKATDSKVGTPPKETSSFGSPSPRPVLDEWIEYLDPKTKRHYYYNEAIQKTQWEKPAQYRAVTPQRS